MYVLKEE